MANMLRFISENPATLTSHPFTRYKKTWERAQRKAIEKGLKSTLNLEALPLTEMHPSEMVWMDVLVFRQGSFTVAVIRYKDNPVSIGYAKRNVDMEDKDNPAKGEHLAVRRAILNCFVEDLKEMDTEPDSLGVQSSPEDEDGVFEVQRVPPEFQDKRVMENFNYIEKNPVVSDTEMDHPVS